MKIWIQLDFVTGWLELGTQALDIVTFHATILHPFMETYSETENSSKIQRIIP
jgi:hypothetical protein